MNTAFVRREANFDFFAINPDYLTVNLFLKITHFLHK
jgi:hypothetical protein